MEASIKSNCCTKNSEVHATATTGWIRAAVYNVRYIFLHSARYILALQSQLGIRPIHVCYFSIVIPPSSLRTLSVYVLTLTMANKAYNSEHSFSRIESWIRTNLRGEKQYWFSQRWKLANFLFFHTFPWKCQNTFIYVCVSVRINISQFSRFTKVIGIFDVNLSCRLLCRSHLCAFSEFIRLNKVLRFAIKKTLS